MGLPDIRLQMQVASDVRITYPLHYQVVRFLEDVPAASMNRRQPGEILSASMVESLNKALAESTVISHLCGTAVLGLTPEVAVKVGFSRSIDVGHLSTLEHIKRHAPPLRVPTPETFGVLMTNTRTYLFMSRIGGEPLESLWPTLSEAQKSSVRDQLESIFADLRAIPAPPLEDGKPTLGGGSPRRCRDVRRNERIATSPISNEEEFNEFLLDTGGRKTVTSRVKMLRSFLRSDHKMVMTHADLHPRNIMVVEESGEAGEVSNIKIVAVIDWEMGGWYPEYWEYVKALNTISPGDGMDDWWEYLPIAAIGHWPGDFAIDVMISRYVD